MKQPITHTPDPYAREILKDRGLKIYIQYANEEGEMFFAYRETVVDVPGFVRQRPVGFCELTEGEAERLANIPAPRESMPDDIGPFFQ